MAPEAKVTIIGGGLAGCEAAWQLLRRGCSVELFEMRPGSSSPAHSTSDLAELVCSNSLRSDSPETASGILKRELRLLDSLILQAADLNRVPAGSALAVERRSFSAHILAKLSSFPGFSLHREEVSRIPEAGNVILAPGPLPAAGLVADLVARLGDSRLYFFDAIAPIVSADSLDMKKLFFASRYGKGDGEDYLNAPFEKEEFLAFYEALLQADRICPMDFDADEKLPHFEGCQPIEVIAKGGPRSLAFGPMRPVGLHSPEGRRYHAVLQLRAENRERSAYNLVGFQTRLRIPEQERVFRMIPGLENARFLRYGSVHKNTFLDSPRVLDSRLAFRVMPWVVAGGQFTGAEGYMESCATGLAAALFMVDKLRPATEGPLPVPPLTSALGSLINHVTASRGVPFQPSNVHFGMMPGGSAAGRKDRRREVSDTAAGAFAAWLADLNRRHPAVISGACNRNE